jgi:hypothetical protein
MKPWHGSVAESRRERPRRDSGAVDVSIEMLFGLMVLLFALLLVFEATTYWHTRNVLDDAASEGARVAAAYDGSCVDGVAAARAAVREHAGRWASRVRVSCVEGAEVRLTISARSPGVGGSLGFVVRVVEAAPKER